MIKLVVLQRSYRILIIYVAKFQLISKQIPTVLTVKKNNVDIANILRLSDETDVLLSLYLG